MAPPSAPAATALGGPPRPRSSNLTHEQKRLICLYARQHPKETQAQLAQWAKGQFQLDHVPSQATISFMLKKRQQFELMAGEELANKKMRTVKHPEVDMALANWFLHCQARQIKLPGELIRSKARVFFDLMAGRLSSAAAKDPPQFSNGWMHSFMNRHGFSRSTRKPKTSNDATASSGSDASPHPEITTKNDLQAVLEGVVQTDVYWLHEARLLCEFCPEKQPQTDGSSQKQLSMLLCVNSDGSDRINPLLVGQEPLDVAEVSHETAQAVQYAWNRRAWLAPLLIRDWLLALDWKMRVADRQVVVLVDSVAAVAMQKISLTNVTMRFVSAAARSFLVAPLEARIVGTVKRWYRHAYLNHVLDQREDGHSNVYDVGIAKVIEWVASGWQQVPRGCISLGFAQAGVLTDPSILSDLEAIEVAPRAEEKMDAQIQTLLKRLKLREPMRLDEFILPRAEHVEEEELTDEDFADSGLHATHGTGASADPAEIEEAAQRLAESESIQPPAPVRAPALHPSHNPRSLVGAVPRPPAVGDVGVTSVMLPDTELLAWTESHQRSVVQAPVDDVQALQRVIQLAREMRCDPSVTLELNRMLLARSGSPTTLGTRTAAAPQPPARPAGVCRFTFGASTRRVV